MVMQYYNTHSPLVWPRIPSKRTVLFITRYIFIVLLQFSWESTYCSLLTMLSLWLFLMSFSCIFFSCSAYLKWVILDLRVKNHRLFCDRKDPREYLFQSFHFICVKLAAKWRKINLQKPYSELNVYCVITRMILFLIENLFQLLLVT